VIANSVYVRNISYQTLSQALGEEFAKFGAIQSVRIISAYNGREHVSLGFGFVEFKAPEGAAAALASPNKIVLDGRTLFVAPSREPRPRKRDTAFVVGIPKGTTQDDIKRAFAAYNPTTVRIIRESDGDRQKGFAFVTFATEDDQDKAVRENRAGIALGGGTSLVRYARPIQRGRVYYRRRAGPQRAPRAPQASAGPDAPQASAGPGAPARDAGAARAGRARRRAGGRARAPRAPQDQAA
jgi:RNA recognition motif-containing protein